MYSDSLKNVVICFTGILPHIRSDYEKKVIYLNGRVSPILDTSVTHLVAAECNSNSEKYVTACELNLPIMNLFWLEHAWNCYERKDFSSMSSIGVITKYILPIFHNTVFSISGFSINERNIIGNLIEINGGKVMTDMKRDECTHLIVRYASGSKYEAAKKWNIHIVNSNWLRKSIQQKIRLKESKCLLEFGNKGNNQLDTIKKTEHLK